MLNTYVGMPTYIFMQAQLIKTNYNKHKYKIPESKKKK